jgi:hypothetical protein
LALVVAQVQVQGVHFIGSDQVDVTLDVFHPEKMPRHIEHGATIGVFRIIADRAGGDLPGAGPGLRAFNRSGQELPEGLHTPEDACGFFCADREKVFCDGHFVSFCTQGIVAAEAEINAF